MKILQLNNSVGSRIIYLLLFEESYVPSWNKLLCNQHHLLARPSLHCSADYFPSALSLVLLAFDHCLPPSQLSYLPHLCPDTSPSSCPAISLHISESYWGINTIAYQYGVRQRRKCEVLNFTSYYNII